VGRLHNSTARRAVLTDIIQDDSPIPSNYIFGPRLPPSVLPYILLSNTLTHLNRQCIVTDGTNAVDYVNSLVVYATVASQYLRDPRDSPLNHREQLQELGSRVAMQAKKIKQQGTPVRVSHDPTILREETQKKSPIGWASDAFDSLRFAMEEQVRRCPRLK
jgi:hypothetical protein